MNDNKIALSEQAVLLSRFYPAEFLLVERERLVTVVAHRGRLLASVPRENGLPRDASVAEEAAAAAAVRLAVEVALKRVAAHALVRSPQRLPVHRH